MRMLGLSLFTILFFSMSFTVRAGFEGLQDGTSLKVFQRINCKSGITCTRTNQGTFNMVATAVLATPVLASATTITVSQCGKTFYNTGAVVINLPEASVALGCSLTFSTLNASNFDINPDNADQILVQTNAVGDAIRNATLGNTITLKAVSASQWVVVGILGTWTDVN